MAKLNSKVRQISVLLFLLMIIPLTSAQNVYMQNDPFEIRHAIRLNGSPSTDILANITIKEPVNSKVIGVGVMSFDPNNLEHNITFNSGNASSLGLYNYCITASNGIDNKTNCFHYEITLSGEKTNVAQALIFWSVGLVSVFFFLLTLFGAIKIPWKNNVAPNGMVLSINDLKYVKLLLWFITYLLAIFVTFSFANISSLGNWDLGFRFFNASFWFLIVFLLPSFVILFVSAYMAFFNDKVLKQLIERNIMGR